MCYNVFFVSLKVQKTAYLSHFFDFSKKICYNIFREKEKREFLRNSLFCCLWGKFPLKNLLIKLIKNKGKDNLL